MADALDAETLARLKLHLVRGLGPKTLQVLFERFESAERILHSTASELATIPNIGEKTAQQLADAFRTVSIDDEMGLVARHQISLMHRESETYPAALREISDAPALLYYRGTVTPADSRCVAIVGSRHCTNYGRRTATRLAEGLARAGWTVVSGLARGIDAAAHQGALKTGGRTLAVLAGGLSKIYPPEHGELADQVAHQGALISEMPMATGPLPELFPRRNRIISGLSRAVVIVEAAEKSGALITARLAGEQGREVLAVPGPLDSEASEGPHQLIRNGATLVRHADDVLEALDALPELVASPNASVPVTKAGVPTVPPPNLSPVQLQLWNALGTDGALVDEIVNSTALPVSEINSALLMMELTGKVRRLPGNRFARK
jgi:DNA processing protein